MQAKMFRNEWTGNRCHFGVLEFWPERGLIHVLNIETKNHEVLSTREALVRTQAIIKGATNEIYPSDRKRMLDFADHMVKCIKIARTQGDPTVMSDLQQMANRRKKSYVQLPSIQAPHKTYYRNPVLV